MVLRIPRNAALVDLNARGGRGGGRRRGGERLFGADGRGRLGGIKTRTLVHIIAPIHLNIPGHDANALRGKLDVRQIFGFAHESRQKRRKGPGAPVVNCVCVKFNLDTHRAFLLVDGGMSGTI